MSATIVWTGVETVTRNMARYGDAVKQVPLQLLTAFAPDIETDAKNDASWVDRTGNARAGLFTRVFQSPDGNQTILILSHGMFYGIFLETRFQGRYATIMPTLQRYYPRVQTALRSALGG